MKVYLVRHATPADPDKDAERPLSEKGIDDILLVAGRMSESGTVAPERIYHSGKLRARQTAEIIARALDLTESVEEAPGLMPYDDTGGWIDFVENGTSDTMLVGHMPFMARMVGRMTGRTGSSFHMSQVTCLERRGPGDWFVLWNMTPDDLR